MVIKRWHWLIAAVALLGGATAAADPAAGAAKKKTFRWVDAQGHVHYSDGITPEAAHRDYSEVDSSGRTNKEIEREKTAEEAATAEREAQAQAAQATYDRYLLQTYPHLDDLTAAYEQQQQSIDLRSASARRALSDNESTLSDLRANRAAAAAEGPDAVVKLQQQIDSYEASGQQTQDALTKLDAERSAALTRFSKDVQRYREITNSAAPAAAHAPQSP